MRPSLLPLLALPALALAQLDTFRATVEGSLHQCQTSELFFFDSGNARPLSVLFLPSASIPASARNGTVMLSDALGYSPVLALSGIETADASGYEFEVQVAEGTEFEIFGFLPDGSGKDLSLTRTVMTPLPDATACLTDVPTALDPAATAAPAATDSDSDSASAAPSTSTSATVAAATSTTFLTTTSLPSRMTVTVTAAATSLPSASASLNASAAGQAAVSSASRAVFASGGARGVLSATSVVLGLGMVGLLTGLC